MKWIKRIIGFIKLYKDYEYEPETFRQIVEDYTTVICNRTRTMSKPTYFYCDVLDEMDKWYEQFEQQAAREAVEDAFAKLEDYEEPDGWLRLKMSSIFQLFELDKDN